VRDGCRRIIVPADAAWDDFFAAPGIELAERDQPPVQFRETL
jgi:antitoxin VapB